VACGTNNSAGFRPAATAISCDLHYNEHLSNKNSHMVALITGIIGIVTAIIIVILIRKDHLHVRYGMWWMGVAVIFALLGLFPALFDNLAKYLGVAYPPILAFTIGGVVLVIKILVMDIERSRKAIQQQRLTQRLALLESDLCDIQRQLNIEQTKDLDQQSPNSQPANQQGTYKE
jgi:hypothetical protein